MLDRFYSLYLGTILTVPKVGMAHTTRSVQVIRPDGSPMMGGGEVAEVVVMLAIFFCGITGGALVIVCRAIKREDRGSSLTRSAPDAVARGTRVLTGLGSRDCRPLGRRT